MGIGCIARPRMALLGLAVAAGLSCTRPGEAPPVHATDRLEGLLARMTVEEKVAQLRCSIADPEAGDVIREEGIGGLGLFSRSLGAREAAEKANRVQELVRRRTRLQIPPIVHDEALHGLVGRGATSFPQAIALAATFDPALLEEVAAAIARETRSRGIHQVLSPVVNLARDVRWGRVEETYGEDPHLAARMGVAFCRAMEREGVVTTPKHLALNVGDGGRDSQAIDVSERLLRETELRPFRACFEEAGARSVMAAYNSLNGIPCSAHPWLLTGLLRGEWGFRGFVVSDYGSVGGIVSLHRAAATKKEGAAQALLAGLDMELPDIDLFGAPLVEAVKEGLVPPEALDRAVRRILEVKLELGLFEAQAADPERAAALNDCAEHRELALRAARKALVLLRNEGGALPLGKDLGTIAVLGPLADTVRLGGYSGTGIRTVSVLEGIRAKVAPGAAVLHEKGCGLPGALPPIPGEVLVPEGGAPGARGLLGEYFANKTLEGPPVFTRVDPRVHFDWETGSPREDIPADFFGVRWSGTIVAPETRTYEITLTAEDGARLWIDGRLLIDSWFPRARGTDRIAVRLEGGRAAALRLDYFHNRGNAFASLGWDWRPGGRDAELEAAVEAARRADAAVVVVGIEEGEGKDRADLDLSREQEELIRRVAEACRRTVVVLVTGSAVTMRRWIGEVPAILQAWYGGEEQGTAVAEALFGEVNPGGRLPITFPRFVGQVPLFYNPRPTGRGTDYVDLTGRPQFPFGHGLSYATFAYGPLRIEPREIPPDGVGLASVAVRNTGPRAGDEVVQLYLRDEVGSVVRPVRELKGFHRVTLAPGEEATVRFGLGPAELSFLGRDLRPVVEPGVFRVMAGGSSEDIRAEGELVVVPAGR